MSLVLPLETCVGKIIRCFDGFRRRVRIVTPLYVVYDVATDFGGWISMGEVRRNEAEKVFTRGQVIE